MIVLVLISLLGAVACHRLARQKHSRHVVAWTALGLALGPLAVPILWLVSGKNGKQA